MNGMQMQSPHSDPLGWIVIVAGMLATVWTIAAAIYWVLRPGEDEPQHAKRLILKDDR